MHPPITLSAPIASPALYRTAGTIEMLPAEAFVHVVGKGIWTAIYIDYHFRLLEQALVRARSAGGGVRVLVDLSQAALQSREVAERIQSWTARIYRRDDRVAIVLASSLLKAQMRRVTRIETRELFLSAKAARTWLLA